jgi:hypothetical protein
MEDSWKTQQHFYTAYQNSDIGCNGKKDNATGISAGVCGEGISECV